MNSGFISSYKLASFLLCLITKACTQHLHEAIFNSSDVELFLDYISPSGNGKEPKSRQYQITVKPRIRSLALVQQYSDAKHRSEIKTGPPGINTFSRLCHPSPPAPTKRTQCPLKALRAAGISKTTVQTFTRDERSQANPQLARMNERTRDLSAEEPLRKSKNVSFLRFVTLAICCNFSIHISNCGNFSF